MSPISKEMEDYIRESIEDFVGLPISEKTLKLKLLVSEEDRRLLQVQNLMLQDREREFNKRFQSSKLHSMSPISKETEDYIRESVKDSVGLPISEKTLKLKLLASEEDRRLLREQNFMLLDRQREFHMRFQSSKEEASMNARGLKKCIQEKETITVKYAAMEKKCKLFERELDEYMESCAELENENNELRAQLQEASFLEATFAEVQSLRQDKKKLLKNLQRAAEEVNFLYKENKSLEEDNKRLQRKLQREQEHHKSEHKQSARDSSSRGKRKSRHEESDIHLNDRSIPHPHSPLYQNSPQSKRLKR